MLFCSKEIPVSEECKLSLLDVLSIYNSNDFEAKPPSMETWYTKNPFLKEENEEVDVKPKEWKKEGEAELMFKELTNKSAQAYCSLIKGMAKVFHIFYNLRV